MKKALYFLVFGTMVAGGLFFAIRFADQPRSETQIPLTFFDDHAAVAAAVAQRFPSEFKSSSVLILGVWPGANDEIAIAQALLARLKDLSMGYDVVLVESELPGAERFTEATKVAFRDDLAGVVDGVGKIHNDGKRIVIVVPSMYSSRLLEGGPADRWHNEFRAPSMNVTLAPFPRRREDEKTFPVQCRTVDEEGIGPLGCAVIHRARWMYRQTKPADKAAVSVERMGDLDYLMLVSPPADSAPAAGSGS